MAWQAEGPSNLRERIFVYPTPNAHVDSNRKIKGAIIHYDAGTYEGSKSWLTDPSSKVSAHYLIGRDGKLCQMCRIQRVAYHAGRNWGNDNPNRWSVGYELCSNASQNYTFTRIQYDILAQLLAWLFKRENLKFIYPDNDPKSYRNRAYWSQIYKGPGFVCGHSAVNNNKPDPGDNFDWKLLKQLYKKYKGGSILYKVGNLLSNLTKRILSKK